jgi:hypothetical protein
MRAPAFVGIMSLSCGLPAAASGKGAQAGARVEIRRV